MIHWPSSSITPASSIAAAHCQCRSTQPGILASDMPLRRQMCSVISRARGSIFEIMAKHSLYVGFADYLGLTWTNEGGQLGGRLRLPCPNVVAIIVSDRPVAAGRTSES